MPKIHDYEFIDEDGIYKIVVLITKYVLDRINDLNGSGIYGGGTNVYNSTAPKDTLRDVNGNDFYPYTTSDAVYYGLTNLSAIIENFNQELDSKALKSDVPTKLSELENDKTYQTLQEINILITNVLPTKLSQLDNDNNYQTLTQVNNLIQSAKLINVSELINDRNYQTDTEVLNTVTLKIAEVVAGADTDFDTLKEISDWIKTHADSASSMNTQIQQNKTDIATLNTNLNNYSLKNHTHNYAGSSSAGGSANSAVKLDSSAGSATQPVYFSGGKPVVCTYTLGKSVPSDAVFTDTWRPVVDNLTSTATDQSLSANQGRLLANGSARDNTKLPLTGGTVTGATTINDTLTLNTSKNKMSYGKITSGAYTTELEGLNIYQTNSESSGIQFNGDYIAMWSPCDDYSLRYFDEDNGNEIWRVSSNGTFYGVGIRLGSSAGNAITAAYTGYLRCNTLTGDRTYYLPDATGTVALTSDLDNYLSLTGGTVTGVINSSLTTSTHLAGNRGTAIINSTASGGYTMLAKMNSSNGYFTHGVYETRYELHYTAKTVVDAGTNTITKSATLLDESGNTSFPGTVSATTFSGSLAWSNITGKPSSYTPASHTHSYLPLTGGTVTGATTINDTLTLNTSKNKMSYGKITSGAYTTELEGLNIYQTNSESSGIQFNGDYIAMWSPCDDYSLRYFDEDNGNEIWRVSSNGTFYGVGIRLGSSAGNAITAAYTGYLRCNTLTGDRTYYLPDATGTVALTSDLDNYLSLTGGTVTGVINSSLTTSTHLAGNRGTAIINSTASGGYTMLAKMNSSNGYFTHGVYETRYELHYTAKTVVDAGTNTITKSATLLDESGNTSFPGTVSATTFSGSLAWSNITGKPSSYTPASHTHSYLPLTGGTTTGQIIVKDAANNRSSCLYGGALALNYGKSTSADTYLEFHKGSNAARYYTRVRAYGNVTANRDIYMPNSGGTLSISSSDIRLKENINDVEIDCALDTIDQIKLHSFDWNDGSHPHQKIGFIADELELLDSRFAEGGGEMEDGSMFIKTVDTFYLAGYIVKALQELHEENKQLRNELDELKSKLNIS